MTRSPSAARLDGDDYQHLVSWYYALHMLLHDSDVTGISMESPSAGIVDDLIVHRRNGNDEYYQIKFSVDSSQAIDNTWWTSSDGKRASILKRFWESFQQLRKPGYTPVLKLYTNRPLDPRDPLLRIRDSENNFLGPRLRTAGPRSEAGKRRRQWADHLGISEEDLLEMLDHLALYTEQGPNSILVTLAGHLMARCGLKSDKYSVEQGRLACREWVKAGVRTINKSMLEAEIQKRSLLGEAPWATFVVQAIDRDPRAANAQASVDWVDLYKGEDPRERRRLEDPSLWNSRLLPELVEAAKKLEAAGHRRIKIEGHMRLPTWFMVGSQLPDTRGFRLACKQRADEWTTEAPQTKVRVHSKNHELGLGSELAVGLSVAGNLESCVLEYIREANLRVRRFVHLYLDETNSQAMPGANEALGWAFSVREHLRGELHETRAQKVHLFLATPSGAALFLGHFWNRMGPTQIYEHFHSAVYERAFFLPA